MIEWSEPPRMIRVAQVLQAYAGTDEIRAGSVARDRLAH